MLRVNDTHKSSKKAIKKEFDYSKAKTALKNIARFNFRTTKHFTPSQKGQIRKAFKIFSENKNAAFVPIPAPRGSAKQKKAQLRKIRKLWGLQGTAFTTVPIYRPPSATLKLNRDGTLEITPANHPDAREKIIPFPAREYVAILDIDDRRLFVENWLFENFDLNFGSFDTLTIYNAHYAPMQSAPSIRLDDKESLNYISDYLERKTDLYILSVVFAISLYRGSP